jgi:hypothetical protein
MAKEALEVHASEKRYRLCKMWHPNIYSRSDSLLETGGILAIIQDGAEMVVGHPANLRHLAYKGVVIYPISEGGTSGVR